jgi:hypothetical protein
LLARDTEQPALQLFERSGNQMTMRESIPNARGKATAADVQITGCICAMGSLLQEM